MNFGEKIKKLRIQKKWTQAYVANKLNISEPALSRYESGMFEPKSLTIVTDFALLYGVTTDYLLGLDVSYDSELDNVSFAFSKDDTKDLSEEDIEEVKNFIEFIKNKKEKK